MKPWGAVILAAAVMMAAGSAFAQGADRAGQSAGAPRLEFETVRELGDVSGRIVSLDFAGRVLALDTGEQFALAPTLKQASLPAVGDEVKVLYAVQDGKRVARAIEVETRVPFGE
jgi:hypothetical protein